MHRNESHRNESHLVSHANWINTRILAAYFPCLLKKREITKLTNGKVNKETSLIAFDVHWNKVLDCMKATRQVKRKRFLFDKIVAESNETKCHGKSVCVEKDKHKKKPSEPSSPFAYGVVLMCLFQFSVAKKVYPGMQHPRNRRFCCANNLLNYIMVFFTLSLFQNTRKKRQYFFY